MQGQSWVHEREQLMHDTFTMFGTKAIGLKQLSVIVQVLTMKQEFVSRHEHSYVLQTSAFLTKEAHEFVVILKIVAVDMVSERG